MPRLGLTSFLRGYHVIKFFLREYTTASASSVPPRVDPPHSSVINPGRINCRIPKRIPRGSRAPCAENLSSILDDIVKDNDGEAWNHLFLFSRRCLAQPNKWKQGSTQRKTGLVGSQSVQQYITLLRMEFLLQILHRPSKDWDERFHEQWLAISSSVSSRMNSFRVHLALRCFTTEDVAVLSTKK